VHREQATKTSTLRQLDERLGYASIIVNNGMMSCSTRQRNSWTTTTMANDACTFNSERMGHTTLLSSTGNLDHTISHHHCDIPFDVSQLLSMEQSVSLLGGQEEGISSQLFVAGAAVTVLLFAVGAFLHANLVFTPQIIMEADRLRKTRRNVEIQKLVSAIQFHLESGNDLNELRIPLEAALGMTLEDYISDVSSSSPSSGILTPSVVVAQPIENNIVGKSNESPLSNSTSYSDGDMLRSYSEADQRLAEILMMELFPK
jgi:hypothetical protein